VFKFIKYVLSIILFGAVYSVVHVCVENHWFHIPDQRLVQSILELRPIKLADVGPSEYLKVLGELYHRQVAGRLTRSRSSLAGLKTY
jgi:hypothetical protein